MKFNAMCDLVLSEKLGDIFFVNDTPETIRLVNADIIDNIQKTSGIKAMHPTNMSRLEAYTFFEDLIESLQDIGSFNEETGKIVYTGKGGSMAEILAGIQSHIRSELDDKELELGSSLTSGKIERAADKIRKFLSSKILNTKGHKSILLDVQGYQLDKERNAEKEEQEALDRLAKDLEDPELEDPTKPVTAIKPETVADLTGGFAPEPKEYDQDIFG